VVGRDVVAVGVGTGVVGTFVGDVGWSVVGCIVVGWDVAGWDVGDVCNLRLIDLATKMISSASSAEDASVGTTFCSTSTVEQAVLSLTQAKSELIESGAYSAFEHTVSSKIHWKLYISIDRNLTSDLTPDMRQSSTPGGEQATEAMEVTVVSTEADAHSPLT
jgi:hypothetical protein